METTSTTEPVPEPVPEPVAEPVATYAQDSTVPLQGGTGAGTTVEAEVVM